MIRQTEEVHRKIGDLLGQLLRLQELQVVVAMELMNLSPGLLEDRKFKTLGKSNEQRLAILTREQATELRGAGELQSLPRVTLF